MDPQTRALLNIWPLDWREWHIAIAMARQRTGLSARSVATRAAWLLRHDWIRREFMDNRQWNGSVATLTRRK